MSETRLDAALQVFQYQTELTLSQGLDLGGRSFQLFGDITEDSLKRVDACLTVLERDNRKAITIKLCSTGGDVNEAMGIVGRICASPCRIIIEAYGIVASAATLILACGDVRRCSALAQFMFHEATVLTQGRISEVKSEVQQVIRQERLFAATMARFCTAPASYWANVGVSAVQYWSQVGIGTDEYFDVSELKAMGVIDEIMEAK